MSTWIVCTRSSAFHGSQSGLQALGPPWLFRHGMPIEYQVQCSVEFPYSKLLKDLDNNTVIVNVSLVL